MSTSSSARASRSRTAAQLKHAVSPSTAAALAPIAAAASVSNKKKRSQPGDRTVQTYKKKQQETKEEEEEDQCIIEDDAGDFDGEVDAAPAAPSPKRRKTNRGAAAKLPSTKANGGELPGGVAHALPSEFASLLRSNSTLRSLWSTSLTPLMRNEWICWAQSAAQEATRDKRRQRMQEALLHEGKRRPCCWPGCKHREKSK